VDGDPRAFLSTYVETYLREEVQQEGLTRNLGAFARFLEAVSFSQGQPLDVSAVARDCHVERKVVEDYVGIPEDLLLAVRIPSFQRRARRRIAAHPKFYFFDAGVYRALRPRGPLDSEDEADLAGLRAFLADYPMATATLAYGGTKRHVEGPIEVIPLGTLLGELPDRIAG